MSERPTPETDAVVFDDPLFANGAVCADFARRLERERDEAAADAARAEAANTIAAAQLAVIEAEGPKPDGIVTRTSWKFEVTDIGALNAARPELCVISPNNAAIRAVVKASNGAAIPGLRIWQEAGAIVRNAAPVKVEDFDY